MSAPKMPVVAAWVWTDEDGQSFCGMQWSAAEAEPDDRPALAVPDALWGDKAFRAAVCARAAALCTQWDYPSLPEYLDAIHAELRARAGEG